jgi:hypothetical protein
MTHYHDNTADKVTTNYDAHLNQTTITTNHDAKASFSGAPHRHGGHGLMMIACCIPMLIIAVVLVATGVASVGFLLFAVACTAMMALMMRGMNGHGQPASQDPASSADTALYK